MCLPLPKGEGWGEGEHCGEKHSDNKLVSHRESCIPGSTDRQSAVIQFAP